jgi:hypothetical protein
MKSISLKTIPKLILISIVSTLTGCHAKNPEKPAGALEIKSGILSIPSASPFLKHIEVISLGSYETREVDFQSVGKMIALSNSSNELTGARTTWSELEPALTKKLDLNLIPEEDGSAYGQTSVSGELSNQIRIGQTVRIRHYRVTEGGWTGTIVKLLPSQDPSTVDVVFHINKARDIYPGTTCEVLFPLLHTRSIKVPTQALVHEGLDEFVWLAVGPNQFRPQKVTPVDGSSEEVILAGGVSEKSKVVSRGAILLKPKIKQILQDNQGAGHAD